MKCYYYLHKNTKDLIRKTYHVVENDPGYFKSPFVEKFWLVDDNDYASKWYLILEACYLNANENSIKRLAKEWELCSIIEAIRAMQKLPRPTDEQVDGMLKYTENILKVDSQAFGVILALIKAAENGEMKLEDSKYCCDEDGREGYVTAVEIGSNPPPFFKEEQEEQQEEQESKIDIDKIKKLFSESIKLKKPTAEETNTPNKRRINFDDLNNQN